MSRDFYELRLSKLLRAFSAIDCEISGNPSSPLIVVDRNKLLHVKLDDHVIHFMDKSEQDHETLQSFNIDGLEISEDFIEDMIENEHFTNVYRLRVKDIELFVAGFDYKIKEGKSINLERYPVFARHKLRYFFSEQQALDTLKTLVGYKLEVI